MRLVGFSLTVVAISIILIFVLAVFSFKHDSITFVSKKYINTFIHDKCHLFFDSMNETDLKVRKLQAKEIYPAIYLQNIIEFSKEEKNILETAVDNIDIHLKPFKNINSISWKITKVNTNIEMGMPHTLHDVIFLSDRFFTNNNFENQMLILLHEKIHVYQRFFPSEAHELIMNVMGFEIKNRSEYWNERIRNNPDLNNLTYGKEDYYTLQVYNTDAQTLLDSTPLKINDHDNSSTARLKTSDFALPDFILQLEHPFEIMASYLPYIILHRISLKNIHAPIIQWIKTNL
jgi:hypothetical protein